MDCEAAREVYVGSLADGEHPTEAVARHLAGCEACRGEVSRLRAGWEALGALPLAEPSGAVGRRVLRRVRWEAAREALGSLERWQQAALAGVMGFLLSLLFGVLVPYEAMVAACRAVAPGLPIAFAYAMGGFVYGLAPMVLAVAVLTRRLAVPRVLGMLEAPVVFLVALVPYVLLRCAEFPPALLAGFIGGLAGGAVLGGGTGLWLGHRHAWA